MQPDGSGETAQAVREPRAADRSVELESHRGWLRRYFGGRTRNADDADDLVQTVMLRATHGLERFRGECPISQWLLRIALNELRLYYSRHLRSHSRLTELEIADEVQRGGAEPHLSIDDGLEVFVGQLIERAKQACSADEVRVILMFYRGETAEGIGAALDMNPATVRSHFLRGRGKLLAHLFVHAPWMLGGDDAFREAAARAARSADPGDRFTRDEEEALRNPKGRAKALRQACLKLARFLPASILLVLFAREVL